ncbi:dienelactone hydrolase family protein [Bacillus pumilus]|uniref:dienelactone hydrolase family protein n=1 Tax=Bacillus pumilus TaxID=1408 RepID=UPI00273E379E|nr:dienelactone hydrolase family protein [Bacillus pumilus]WLP60126.1 dienelactone hydrolase family protein [Bacillus pumilus]
MQTSHQKPVIILIHEIYGINDHMKSMIQHFELAGFHVYCPHLLGRVKSFNDEREGDAYRYFMNEVGFERSVNTVLHIAKEIKMKNEDINLFVLGFSVGATVAWLCSQHGDLFSGVIGFYGSRIRDYVTILPKCETLLFFPSIEYSFNPKEMVEVLEGKNGLHVLTVEGKHGFANPFSEAFEKASRDLCFQKMSEFIKANTNTDRSAERI